ncbi:general substrate transporter [Apiospora arundinis]|uniref:General substrate transporter n=1 Tax=Apiospora arundinis TaxID=335852 RepID=A0ABR2JGJ8_9PEZI
MSSGLRQWTHDVSPYLIFLIAVSTLGSLQFGIHLAELNAPEDVITCRKKSISTRALPDCIPMDNAAFAAVQSVFTIGGLIGSLGAGPTSSAKGRLFAMRLTSGFFVLGSLIETFASAVPVIALGRLLAGVGAGAATVIVPLYISEVAPPRERGFFGVMTQISINIGILLTQTLGYFFSYGSAWRWVLGTGVVVGAVHASGLLVVPESPAWMAANENVTKAKKTLQRIRGSGYDINEETILWGPDLAAPEEEAGLLDGEIGVAPPTSPAAAALVAAAGRKAPGESGSHKSFVEVIRDPLTRPAIIAVVGIMLSQQLCGINSIIMYSVSLLADLLPISSALLTILISVINLVTTVACSPLPDKLGRKTCLLLSIVGQGTSALCLALSIMFEIKILSAVLVLCFVASFAVGLGPVPFMMASEMVGQDAVGAAQSWALGANWVATFLVAQFFPLINKALNSQFGGAGWVYFIFAALAAGCAMFVWWRVPETKGKANADEVWGRTHRLE